MNKDHQPLTEAEIQEALRRLRAIEASEQAKDHSDGLCDCGCCDFEQDHID